VRSRLAARRAGFVVPAAGLAILAGCVGPARAQESGGPLTSLANVEAPAALPWDTAGPVGPPEPPAVAGAVLPPLGTDPTSPGLAQTLTNAFGTPAAAPTGNGPPAPALQISPSITVAEEYTTNASLVAGGGVPTNGQHSSDWITLISPAISLVDDTQRVRVNLNYAPTGQIYAENPSYDQFRQQASGEVLATVLSDLLYFDTRGTIAEQPVFGGLGYGNATVLSPDQRETVGTVAASPYVYRNFAGIGAVQAGVGYIYTGTDAPAYLNQPAEGLEVGLPYNYGSSWLATRRVFGSFTTGDEFERFQDRLAEDGSFYDGSGALRDGRRVVVTDDASYAVNRYVAALGEIGYENLNYPEQAVSYIGGIWAAGARLTPRQGATLTAEWRYLDGFGAPYVYGSWQVTPRLVLQGGYSEGITNFDQDQQNSLLAGNATSTSVLGSALQGAPLLNSSALAGQSQALSHLRRLDFNATFISGRDTVYATVDWERSTILGNLLGLPTSVAERIYSQAVLQEYGLLVTNTTNILNGGLNWQHQLRPTLTLQVYGGYSRARQAALADATSSTIQVTASVQKEISQTIAARLTYAGNYAVGSFDAEGYGSPDTHTVTLSVTKRF
jgi:uncharacterized protein (PEP-CTERM system associated)